MKLTAFIPTDKAFLKLASDLTGKKVTSEKKAFTTVAGLGIDTVETVLLYHVVAGSKINAKAALKANSATLTTAQGGTFTVRFRSARQSSCGITIELAQPTGCTRADGHQQGQAEPADCPRN